MKVASSILSWIGGVLTISYFWLYFGLLNYFSSDIGLLLLSISIGYTVFALAILIVRQCVMGKGAQIPFGILTLIFVSLIGGIFTLFIPLDRNQKKEERVESYVSYEQPKKSNKKRKGKQGTNRLYDIVEEDGRKYRYIRPIPDVVLTCQKELLSSANDHEYSKNTDLEAVQLAQGVERLEIGAFSNCINLVTITLPKSVKYIGTNCFFNCKKLRYIIYKGNQLDWAKISRGSNWLLRAGTVSVYCEDGSLTVDPNR